MVRQYKCVFCNENITESENKIPIKNRYAHERCFNVSLKATDKKQKETRQKKLAERKSKTTVRVKMQEELKEGLTEEEYQEKRKLFNKIREIQGTEKVTAKTYKLIDDYVKKYGFTYSGMEQALKYFYEIENNTFSEDCVGIIPYIYDNAKEYFESIIQAAEKNANSNIQQITRVIKITPYKDKKDFIDITKIGQ